MSKAQQAAFPFLYYTPAERRRRARKHSGKLRQRARSIPLLQPFPLLRVDRETIILMIRMCLPRIRPADYTIRELSPQHFIVRVIRPNAALEILRRMVQHNCVYTGETIVAIEADASVPCP